MFSSEDYLGAMRTMLWCAAQRERMQDHLVAKYYDDIAAQYLETAILYNQGDINGKD